MKKAVINPKYLPTRLPATTTLLWIVFIKAFNVTGVWLGILVSLLVLWWLIALYTVAREKYYNAVLKEEGKDERAAYYLDNKDENNWMYTIAQSLHKKDKNRQ